MSENKAQTLKEKWEIFAKPIRDDFWNDPHSCKCLSTQERDEVHRETARHTYYNKVRVGLWNQQRALDAWEYYLAAEARRNQMPTKNKQLQLDFGEPDFD